MLGGGYRAGEVDGGYVSFGYIASPAATPNTFWFFKGSVGEDLVQASIGVAFQWP